MNLGGDMLRILSWWALWNKFTDNFACCKKFNWWTVKPYSLLYVCMCKGGPWPSLIYCASPLSNPLLILHFRWNVGPHLWGRHNSHLVPWSTGPGDKILNKLWPHDHIEQVGSSVSSSLKRCPIGWQCPLTSSITHLNWSLFSFNRSFVLVTGGPSINPFACLSPIMTSQCFLWFLFVQSQTAFLATQIEMLQAGSGPVNRCSDPVLASWSTISLPTIPSWPGTHISWTIMFGQLYEGLVAVPDQFW
jgi:hypothetical protein